MYEFKKLQQEHHKTIMENNNCISKLRQELHAIQKNKLSNSNNDNDDILILNNQLKECSKQNQILNNSLQKLSVTISNKII